jgi:hypothetical protein
MLAVVASGQDARVFWVPLGDDPATYASGTTIVPAVPGEIVPMAIYFQGLGGADLLTSGVQTWVKSVGTPSGSGSAGGGVEVFDCTIKERRGIWVDKTRPDYAGFNSTVLASHDCPNDGTPPYRFGAAVINVQVEPPNETIPGAPDGAYFLQVHFEMSPDAHGRFVIDYVDTDAFPDYVTVVMRDEAGAQVVLSSLLDVLVFDVACDEPCGACCTVDGCANVTESECAAQGGLFAGVDKLCAGADCNGTTFDDTCDVLEGVSFDCDGNFVPDECDPDCQPNGTPDTCDIEDGTSNDCDGNFVPDECDPDCQPNGTPDACDIADGTSDDCNANGQPDECDLAGGSSLDCDGNLVPDECDVGSGSSPDCNANQIPDECDLETISPDCNGNGVPDECDRDCNDDGVVDECATGCFEGCECFDYDACTFDECLDGVCVNTPGPYGDVDHNGVANLIDIFCVLDLIAGMPADCTPENGDVHPCTGDGAINLLDAFAVLDAAIGNDPCCGT